MKLKGTTWKHLELKPESIFERNQKWMKVSHATCVNGHKDVVKSLIAKTLILNGEDISRYKKCKKSSLQIG